MFQQDTKALQQFKNLVAIKFQLYNGLFTALPFHHIENTGILLSMLLSECESGFEEKLSPVEIIDQFFQKQLPQKSLSERLDMLFRFTQYAERQVVLFDALEDAAFTSVHDTTGAGTLKHLLSEVETQGREKDFIKQLNDFSVQLVLTAHPTQFYTGSVLGIIHDTTKAVKENNVLNINTYLHQLGKTPFLKKQQPTPYDEAISLMWFLENVFYNAAGKILSQISARYPEQHFLHNPLVKMGFWPGGDRDGNPFVKVDTTLKVAQALRSTILKCYYMDVRKMRRRLTFSGVEPLVIQLEKLLYQNVFIPDNPVQVSQQIILGTLYEMKEILLRDHDGLFVHLVNDLVQKVQIFGLHFATLDIRQESSVHNNTLEQIAATENILPKKYAELADADKIIALQNIHAVVNTELYNDLAKDSLETIKGMQHIQTFNGEAGCNRYIISQCKSALNVLEVYALFQLTGWETNQITADIVPLFETIEDLSNAASVMKILYENEQYAAHLERRNNRQTIMLGFSDGTKDGGYLMANWSIYKAKEALTAIAKNYGIEVVFFDGRGGPPARGGGKTHRFYSSMGQNISNKEIQITVQGQTISSSFGTVDSAKYNIEQLINAGISNALFSTLKVTMNKDADQLISQLASVSFEKYIGLKNHPNFMQYLNEVSPLQYYNETNIGSRPSKRGKGALTLKDLRAIPFVGAWSQLKQNVTGFYGVGTALEKLEKEGRFDEIKQVYSQSLFVKTLFDNCEMAMKKSFFPLTAYLSKHPVYGEIWDMIYDEYLRTKKYILALSGHQVLMENYVVDKLSVEMRERIVLPLSTIQQYAIAKINELEDINSTEHEVYKKLIIRCSFGIINAARNSV